MKSVMEILNAIIKERPLGSEENKNIINILEKEALEMKYEMISLPFECKYWKKDKSYIKMGELSYELLPSPFSKEYIGEGKISVINTLEELKKIDLNEKIVVLQGEIVKEQLQPKDFPFYYPDEHKQIIVILEEKKPKAIIAITGKHSMCGLEPFPLFEDGNFSIPSAYIRKLNLDDNLIEEQNVSIRIDSEVINEKSRQIIAVRKAKNNAIGKIIVCAHMDSKYGTLGALDNAAGVAVMLEVMKKLKDYNGDYDIHFVPFNGEEYFEVKGELEYLEYIREEIDSVKLVINIDSPCYKGSQTALSTYNFKDELSIKLKDQIIKNKNIVMGREWYAGDHSMFVYKKIPCMAVTSSDLFGAILEITHTKEDSIDKIDYNLIKESSNFLVGFINSL